MNRLKIGVVGVGHLGRHHARIFAAMPEVELVGVVDGRVEQGRTVAESCGTRSFTDYRDLLGQVDAISVAVPTSAHREVAGAFLDRGIPTLVEKPLATTLLEAEELVELANRKGLQLSSAPSSLLGETAQTLWRALSKNEIGPVRVVYADLDDGPFHLMEPHTWRSPSGAPFDYQEEVR